MKGAICFQFFFFLLLTFCCYAQDGFQIKRYSIGYRISQIDAIGTNPTDIAPLLKDPVTYNRFINSFNFNSLYGYPVPLTVHTFYLNAEVYKNHLYGFWKHAYLQSGLFITNKLSVPAGAIEKIDRSDSIWHSDKYSLIHNTQFFGINIGANKTFKLGRRLQSTIGFQLQGAVAYLHSYQPERDSSRRYPNSPWEITSTKHLSALEAKHFFQLELMLPLGLEYELCKNKVFMRIEAVPAIIKDKYQKFYSANPEAHAAGLWLIYKLK